MVCGVDMLFKEVLTLLDNGNIKSKHYLLNDSDHMFYIAPKGSPKKYRVPLETGYSYDDIVEKSKAYDVYLNISPYVMKPQGLNNNRILDGTKPSSPIITLLEKHYLSQTKCDFLPCYIYHTNEDKGSVDLKDSNFKSFILYHHFRKKYFFCIAGNDSFTSKIINRVKLYGVGDIDALVLPLKFPHCERFHEYMKVLSSLFPSKIDRPFDDTDYW